MMRILRRELRTHWTACCTTRPRQLPSRGLQPLPKRWLQRSGATGKAAKSSSRRASLSRFTQTVPPSSRAACRAAARPPRWLQRCWCSRTWRGKIGTEGFVVEAEPWNGLLVGGNKGMWSLWSKDDAGVHICMVYCITVYRYFFLGDKE